MLRNLCDDSKTRFARKLRLSPTRQEAEMWRHIRARRLAGAKFRRQSVILGWIADFYCAGSKLVVEIDGATHLKEKDERRDQAMRAVGIRTLRFANAEIDHDVAGVLRRIRQAL